MFSLSRILELSLFPYAVILQVTPIVAIAPLIIIWVREPFLALLVCAWIVAFFPIVSNTTVGLNSADRNLLALFRLYGASPRQTLRYLRLPTALPYFLAGLRISGGLALIGAVVAEFVAGTGGAETGLAFRILEAGYRLAIPRLFAALFLLSLTGIVIYLVLDFLSRLLLRHWHESAIAEEEDRTSAMRTARLRRPLAPPCTLALRTLALCGQPRPTNGILVAITVRNWTLASGVTVAHEARRRGRRCRHPSSARSMTSPLGCGTPRVIRWVISVRALPTSIWPHEMSYLRPSSEVDLVRPVIACLAVV